MKIFAYIAVLISTVMVMVYSVGVYLSPVDKLETSDAVIAVSGGDTEARTVKAIKLYQEDFTDEIIFSGDALDPASKSNAQAMKEIAIKHNVPAKDINIEENARNTAENARNTAKLLKNGDYDKIILVTSPYHQRRAYIEFKRNIPGQITLLNSPALDKDWSRNTWFLRSTGIRLTLSELPKTLFLHLRDIFSFIIF